MARLIRYAVVISNIVYYDSFLTKASAEVYADYLKRYYRYKRVKVVKLGKVK